MTKCTCKIATAQNNIGVRYELVESGFTLKCEACIKADKLQLVTLENFELLYDIVLKTSKQQGPLAEESNEAIQKIKRGTE